MKLTACSDCGGRLIYGEPLHVSRCTENGRTVATYRCRTCIEDISKAFWDADDRGPYPYEYQRAIQFQGRA